MKIFRYLQILVLVLAGMLAASPRAGAQLFFSFIGSAGTNLVNNPLTYTINLTNQTLGLLNVNVTNTFPTWAQLQGASFTVGTGTTFTNADGFSFSVTLTAPTGPAPIAQMVETVTPTQAGPFTNTIIISLVSGTNFTTNLVTLVTNSVAPEADLGVAIFGPAQAVITNDWMTYEVTATNAGPSSAANVALTNTLPSGVILLSAPPHQGTDSNMIFTLGTLVSGGFTNFLFTIQPTNAGDLTLSASIGTASVLDTNLANNSVSTDINVIAYLPATLVAVTNSGQGIDFANGSMAQSILLSNLGKNDVPAARIVVTGLTNRLFNAVGTNNGDPFVYCSAPLAAGQSVNLLLEYVPRGYFPFTNGQLQAFAVPLPDWTPPLAMATSTNFNLIRPILLANGYVLLEWPAITNRSYTVVYSDNVLFSNAQIAPPSVVAPANRVQWLDYGPPETASVPTNSTSRFYRLLLNP